MANSLVNFNRYFYRYVPPRPLEEIESEIRAIETDIVRMLGESTGSSTVDKKVRRWARVTMGRNAQNVGSSM